MESSLWAIAVMGGAGKIPQDEAHQDHINGLIAAVTRGASFLQESSLDRKKLPHLTEEPVAVSAAVAAVQAFEDNPLFNAGCGSVLTSAKTVELEASVINGQTQRSGAVTGLTTVMNPILLASVVLVDSRYQFLGFEHAEAFSCRYPELIEHRQNSHFITERRFRSLERALAREASSNSRKKTKRTSIPQEPETVGAVVLDTDGNLACATSTGGRTAKVPGRIGDTPMVGAGSYAQNGLCALSGSGNGEEFIRHSAATRIACAMEYGGKGFQEAVKHVVFERFPRGAGGFIGVDKDGNIVQEFNCLGLYRASMDSRGRRKVGIWEEDMDF